MSDDPARPEFPLTVKARMLVDVVAHPPRLSLGDAIVGERSTATFDLELVDPAVEIRSVTVEEPAEKFELRALDTADGGSPRYELTFLGNDEVATFKTRIRVETNGKNTPELILSVIARATLNLSYSRSHRFARRGDSYRPRTIRINARRGDAPKIKKIVDPDGLLAFEVLEPRGTMAQIRAEVVEQNVAGLEGQPLRGPHALVVHTDDRMEPKVELEYLLLPETRARPKGRPHARAFLRGQAATGAGE